MPWVVYVLASGTGRRTYVGTTTDLERRLGQHNGELPGGAKSTRAGRPWRVAATYGPFATQSEAQSVEWEIKRRPSADRLRTRCVRARCMLAFFLVAACGGDDTTPPPIESASGVDSSSTTTTTGGDCSPYADPLAECGAGFECSVLLEECRPSPGEGALGDPCEVTDYEALLDDCEPSLLCIPFGGGHSRCMNLCDPDVGACPGEAICIEIDNDDEMVPVRAGLCFEPCSLLQQDCRWEGTSCYVILGVGLEVGGGCFATGSPGPGERCDGVDDCAPGNVCWNAEFVPGCDDPETCCTPLCDADAPACDAPASCIDLGAPLEPNAGVCAG